MQKSLGPLGVPFGAPLPLVVQEFGRGKPVLSVVAGLHGTAYDGVYLCYRLIEWLRRQEQRQGDYQLRGRVRGLSGGEPLGLLTGRHPWPFDHTDLDRVFPGYAQGETTQRLAHWLFDQVRHCDVAVDLQGAEPTLIEWPRVEVFPDQPRALDLAKTLALPSIWIRRPTHPRTAAIGGTLAFNLVQVGVDTLVVRTGRGIAPIDPAGCAPLLAGLVRLMLQLGVVVGPPPEPIPAAPSRLLAVQNTHPVHCRRPGLFIPAVAIGTTLAPGAVLGQVVDPLRGELLEEPVASEGGLLLALRVHPVVWEGSLIACIEPAPRPAAEGSNHR